MTQATREKEPSHIDYHPAEEANIRHKIYSKDHARIDVGLGLSIYLNTHELDTLRRELELAAKEIAAENSLADDPLKEIWDEAALAN